MTLKIQDVSEDQYSVRELWTGTLAELRAEFLLRCQDYPKDEYDTALGQRSLPHADGTSSAMFYRKTQKD